MAAVRRVVGLLGHRAGARCACSASEGTTTMTDDTPEHISWLAARDRLRAAVGPAALEEAARRDIGTQMLFDAGARIMAASEMAEHMRSRDLWSRPAEPNWGWEEENDGE